MSPDPGRCCGFVHLLRSGGGGRARPLMHASPPRTPLHCAASCNDTAICTALVQHGAAIFATTLSDGATAIEKCDPYREGYADCATYLAGARQRWGASVLRKGVVGTAARQQLAIGEGEEADSQSQERRHGGCTHQVGGS